MIITGFDIETTGLSADKGHCVIEVAMIHYDYTTEKEIARYIQRVNPGRSIDAGAQNVHGISIEDLASEPVWGDVAAECHKQIAKTDLLMCHNLMFDAPFIATEFTRVGLELPDVEAFCTMENGRWATATGKYPKLAELCWSVGVDYDADAAHAADYDVEVMVAAFFAARRLGFFTEAYE